MSARARDAVVIGVGNAFRRDDGAGPAVVHALAEEPSAVPAYARLVVCDGEPSRLVDLWDGAGLTIVVDTVPSDPDQGTEPGDLLRWEWDPRTGHPVLTGLGASGSAPSARPVPGFLGAEPATTHALGPGAAIGLAQALHRLPSRLVVLAVVGSDFGQGPGLSEQVAAAVPAAATRIAFELR